MKSLIICLIMTILIVGGCTMVNKIEEKTRDIPAPLSPEFVKCVEEHGLIDLIDRNSSGYDSRALVNGKLEVCYKANN